MRQRSRGRHRSGRWAAYLLGAFAVVAPQLLGGGTELTQLVIVVAGAAVALCCAFVLPRTGTALGTVPLAAVGACTAALWTLIQALPIPCAWSGWAQPERAQLTRALLDLRAIDAARCSLSLSPGSTLSQVGLAATLAALLLSATLAARAGYRRPLLNAVALSSVTMAVVALAHAIADAETVFGLYRPQQARPQFLLAPLMNENHLAGHISLGFPLCLAFASSHRRLEGKILWWTAAMVTLASGLLTLSRGGVGALAFGCVGYLLMEWRNHSTGRKSAFPAATFGAALVCVAVGFLFSADLVAKQFEPHEGSLHKLGVALRVGRLAAEHPWVGIGRGALGDVSAGIIVQNRRLMFAENFAIQWLVEWGAPMALAIGAAFCGSFIKLRLKQRADRALACGVFALILQNLVDFSLELAGVASVAAVALGVLVSRERPTLRHDWFQQRLRARSVLVGAAAAAVMSVVVSAPWLTVYAHTGVQQKIAAEIAGSEPAAQVRGQLSDAFAYYPLDPAFLVLGSALAVRDAAPDAPRWLNLAFASADGWAAPHLQSAVFLERRGNLDQAAIEYGLAVELDASLQGASCEFLKRHPSPALTWTITRPGAPSEQVLRESMVDCLIQDHHWASASKALEPLLERYPTSEYGNRRSVLAAANLGEPQLALQRARSMVRKLPRSAVAHSTLMEVLLQQTAPTEALQIAAEAPVLIRESQAVLVQEARAAAMMRDEGRLVQVLDLLLARYGTAREARSGLLVFASQQFSVAGNHLAALSRAQGAYALSGDPALLELAHDAAIKAGLLSAALRTAAELCNVGHRGRVFCGQKGPAGPIPR